MNRNPDDELLSTGEFAHRTRLTIKALRVYHETGVLRPAYVDPSTGHRRYCVGQVRLGLLIGLLRGADMGLPEIGQLLGAFEADRGAAADRLDRFLRELEIRHTGRRFLIRHIHAILREEDQPMFAIHTRHVPAQRVMSIQRRLRAPETEGFVREAKAAFADHLDGASPDRPVHADLPWHRRP